MKLLFLLLWLSGGVYGATIHVPPGGDLQAALNAAQPGDTITLLAGGVYNTPFNFTAFTLPNKGSSSSYITITSTIAPPADGVRVTLADRANMPKLVASVGAPGFFNAANRANHYRLSGLWFTNIKNANQSGTVFLLGGGNDITGTTVPNGGGDITQYPHDIIVDHCFFNPVDWDEDNQQNLYSSVNYAVELLGKDISVRDSQMVGFGARYAEDHSVILDSGCVLVGVAPGPFTVANNFCEGWFVGFFTGGGDPGTSNFGTVIASTTTTMTLSNVTNLQVGDNITFQAVRPNPSNPGNEAWCFSTVLSISGTSITTTPVQVRGTNGNKQNGPAPLVGGESRWRGWNPSNITISRNYFNKPVRWFNLNGSDGKGFFEMKLCDTCLIDGNVFNGNSSFTVTVRNQGGAAPWSVIKNVTLSNNLAVRFGWGVTSLFFDNERLSQESSNIVFTNNLMYGDSGTIGGINPKIFSGTYGDNVQFTHNTVLQSGEMVRLGNGIEWAGIDATTNFVWRDNLTNWGTSPPNGYACLDGARTVCTPDYVWNKNVMIGAPNDQVNTFPGSNWNPATVDLVGFANVAQNNYCLAPSSPYHNAASDGTDVGVNCTTLIQALGFNPFGGNAKLRGHMKVRGKVTLAP